jgi:hypothetical protein
MSNVCGIIVYKFVREDVLSAEYNSHRSENSHKIKVYGMKLRIWTAVGTVSLVRCAGYLLGGD